MVPAQVSATAAAHSYTAGMREREELRRALEQSDRLLSKVRELEEQNTQLHKDKNEVATKYRAVSSALSLFASPVSFFPFAKVIPLLIHSLDTLELRGFGIQSKFLLDKGFCTWSLYEPLMDEIKWIMIP